VAIAQGLLTLEEFLCLPEEKPALEYVDGVITQKMSPETHHSILQLWISARADAAGVPGRLAKAFPELRTTFAGKSFVPDVAILRWERIPLTAEGEVAGGQFRAPADIAFEISSPEQSVRTLDSKCLWYVVNGVPIAVLVDAEDRMVRVYRAGVPTALLRDDDPIDLSEVVTGLRFTPRELFGALKLR
jgi:Uma2 family endonuclease